MVEKKRSKNSFNSQQYPRIPLIRIDETYAHLLNKENAIPHCSNRTVQNYFNVAVKEERQTPCFFHTEVDLQDAAPVECSATCACGDCHHLIDDKQREKEAFLAQIAKSGCLDNMPPLRKLTEKDLLRRNTPVTFSSMETEASVPTPTPLSSVGIQTASQPPNKLKYKCKNCLSEFTTLEYFKHHQTAHYQKLIGCAYCSATFPTKKKLLSHVFFHVNKNFYSCSYCGASFARKQELRKHIPTHENKNLLACSTCPAKFEKRIEFENHQRQHQFKSTGALVHVFRKVNSCSADEAAAVVDNNLTNSGFYTCDKCKKLSFRTQAVLKKHNAIHERRGGMHVCVTCDAHFMSKMRLKMHQKFAH